MQPRAPHMHQPLSRRWAAPSLPSSESRVYLVPPGPCDKEWAGTAYLGCDGTFQCRAWIAGNHWGDENVGAGRPARRHAAPPRQPAGPRCSPRCPLPLAPLPRLRPARPHPRHQRHVPPRSRNSPSWPCLPLPSLHLAFSPLQAIAHELSHNMFMQHAGTTTGASFPGGSFNEYDDLSCAMGWCCDNRVGGAGASAGERLQAWGPPPHALPACLQPPSLPFAALGMNLPRAAGRAAAHRLCWPRRLPPACLCARVQCWNMPHAWQMGWNAARTYDAATLIRGRTYNVSLGSQSRYAATDLPVRNSIRVLPWNVPGVGANKPVPLWISFRTRTRGDMGLAAGWDDKVGARAYICVHHAPCCHPLFSLPSATPKQAHARPARPLPLPLPLPLFCPWPLHSPQFSPHACNCRRSLPFLFQFHSKFNYILSFNLCYCRSTSTPPASQTPTTRPLPTGRPCWAVRTVVPQPYCCRTHAVPLALLPMSRCAACRAPAVPVCPVLGGTAATLGAAALLRAAALARAHAHHPHNHTHHLRPAPASHRLPRPAPAPPLPLPSRRSGRDMDPPCAERHRAALPQQQPQRRCGHAVPVLPTRDLPVLPVQLGL